MVPETKTPERQIPTTLAAYGSVEKGRRSLAFEKVKTPSGRILFSLTLQVDGIFRKRILFDLELKGDLVALLQKGSYELRELSAGDDTQKRPAQQPRVRRDR